MAVVFVAMAIGNTVFAQDNSTAIIYVNNKKTFTQKDEYVTKDGKTTKTVSYDEISGRNAVKTKITYDPKTFQFFDFNQEDSRTGQLENIVHKGDSYTITYRKNKGAKVEQKVLTEKGFILSGALMSLYISRNLDKLIAGQDVTFSFPAASMQQFVSFTAEKADDKTVDGVAYTGIKLYISTWVLRMLVDPMYFYFEKTGARRIKYYEGRLTPSDEKGDPLVGKVVFSY
ncbi:MAG: hypothetical protein K2Q22_07795 [Cytophagales bacterium]|nr:hypothetical protein [Cytophagales bacterium]